MYTKWYGLFSHTGKELENLVQEIEGPPFLKVAITNNSKYEGLLPYVKLSSTKHVHEWLMQPENVGDNSLITLNGYMGIIPADVLRNLKERGCKVYNIHPAPIQHYPELRGKDPQERMYEGIQEGRYKFIGVVIHEVDPGIDTGNIVHWSLQLADPSITKDELYERLHEMGTEAWEHFFRERIYENGENT